MMRSSPNQHKKGLLCGNAENIEFLKGYDAANDFESKMDNYVRNNAFPKLKLENAVI